MKSVLHNFMEESKAIDVSAPAESETKVGSSSTVQVSSGQLLLAGCNDWDNATAKTPNGLPTIHRVNLGSEVENIFSSSSSLHEFTLLADGTVRAMGKNDRGQLGTGDLISRELPVSVTLPCSDKVVKIATGRGHTLVLFASGEVWGCGACNFGQLGTGISKTAAKDSLKFVKVPFTTAVRDIACGYDFSLACTVDGALYAFGHPEYGVTGQGTDGQYIKDGGKGAAVQYSCEYTPKRITKFVTKDNHGKVTSTIDGSVTRIQDAPVNAQKKVREIVCGGSFSITVSESRHLSYWGKMSNAPRGEATVYPQIQQELFDYPVRRVAAGSNLIVIIAGVNNRAKKINGAEAGPCVGIAWGAPVAGKIGFEGDAKSSTNPKMLAAYDGLDVLKVSCGYGHVSLVAANSVPEEGDAKAVLDKLSSFAVLDAVAAPAAAAKGGKKKADEAKAPAAKKAKK